MSNRYFMVGIGRYFLVLTIPRLKEVSVGTFWYHFFDGKGDTGPLFEQKGGTGPLLNTVSPLFAEKRSSHQTGNTDRYIDCPVNLEEPIRLPSPHWFNFSVHLSVCLFVMKTRRIFT
jgi:hypothetical protein